MACAEAALRVDSNNYDVRQAAARCLIRCDRYAEAETHLNWCLNRRGDDEKLRDLARFVVRKRLERDGAVLQAEKPPPRRR